MLSANDAWRPLPDTTALSMASSHYLNLTKFQLVWRRLCDVRFVSCCLLERILTAVCALPECRSGRNCNTHPYILWPFQYSFYFRADWYRFESYWTCTAWMPHLVRRVDPLFLLLPCISSSFHPFRFCPICLASSFLPCLTCSTLPRFHPPSLTPNCPFSIFPIHPGGSGGSWKAKRSYVIFISFMYKMSTRYVQCVPTTASKNLERRMPGETIFIRFKYQTVETIRMCCKIVDGCRQSLLTLAKAPVVIHPRQNLARFATTLPNFVFQHPNTNGHN